MCDYKNCTNFRLTGMLYCETHLRVIYDEYLEEQGFTPFEKLSDEDKQWAAEGWMESNSD